MSHLHLQLHSQAPSLSSSSTSRFSFLKLFTNNTFSLSPTTNSLPFKPLTIRCRHSDVFETGTNPSIPTSTPNNNNPSGISIFPFIFFNRFTHFLLNLFRYSEITKPHFLKIIFLIVFWRQIKIKYNKNYG